MWRILAVVLFAANLLAQPSVVATWNDPNQGAFANCSATVTANCLAGYNLYDTTNGRTKLNSTVIPVPAGAMPTTLVTYTLGPYPNLGSRTIVATEAYVDGFGTAQESADSNTAAFIVKPASPASLSITVK